MSILNYGGCDKCNKRRCDIKMVLCNVLPANVCDMMGGYIIANDCWKCHWMKAREEKSLDVTDYMKDKHTLTKPELQLLFFREYQPSELRMGYRNKTSTRFNKEISRLLDKQSVKEKYASNKMKLQAIRSFCKRDRDAINFAIMGCHSQKELNKLFSHLITTIGNRYSFKNRDYNAIDLVKGFLVEYVDDRIGDNKLYCDMKEIREHMDNLFK